MRGLLVVAHGSRRAESNAEIFALRGRLQQKSADYSWIDVAFLEITEPRVPEQIDAAAAAGVTQLTIFPHFLAAGVHVHKDLPELADQGRQRHPGLSIHIGPHLGVREELTDLILHSV